MNTVLVHDNYGINDKGHFTVAGVDTVELAGEYGTPLYVLDEGKIREMCRTYKSAVKKYFPEGSQVVFASKALCFVDIYEIMKQERMFADAVSLGEIFTSRAAGFNSKDLVFHGNNKTDEELKYAIASKVGFVVIDNFQELEILEGLCEKFDKTMDIMLRLSPGIDPHTNKKIMTGSVDSKFGIAIENGQAMEFVKAALSCKKLKLRGVHCHVGSQIFDVEPFIDGAEIMLKFLNDVRQQTGKEFEILNLGGGFGVRYVPGEKNADIDEIIRLLSERIKEKCNEYGLKFPKIYLEPGRSIVAAAGVTLYTVGTVKNIEGYKNYISVDGGMSDNPRYALYESPYYCLIANKADKDMDFVATIVGKCCESGDIIQENVSIQKACRGDILAVNVTGAYNYTMASNYNKIPRPAIVSVNTKEGRTKISVKRESLADLIRNEVH